ncbi:AMP-binding protein, partial [Nonomuraea sp. KC401]|uniref:non-ribosomal peptide synthetase n=2 Tax=unclassified Nonomuraea TaxID=2593643 RepID=UPI001486A897
MGVFDNFFDLGGDSLLANRVVTRLAEATGRDVGVGDLWRHATVAQLAGLLRERELPRLAGAVAEAGPGESTQAGDLPLSAGQRQIWLAERLRPGTAAYHVPILLELRGPLDVAALRRALIAVTERHAELRARFPSRPDGPVRLIAPEAGDPLTVIEAGPRDEALRDLVQEARRPFDLEAGPLTRAVLGRIADDHHILLWVAHHLVVDGVSLGIILGDLAEAYWATPIRPASGSYEEYVRATAARRDRALGHRWEQLAGLSPLELSADRPTPPVRSLAGAVVSTLLDEELTRQLRASARTSGTSLFVTLLSAYAAALSRHSGRDEFGIGTFAGDRPGTRWDRLVGMCVDTVVLRADLTGNPSLAEIRRRLHIDVADALNNRDIPFDRLVAEVGGRRDPARHPLFQVSFGYQSRPWTAGATLAGVNVSPLPVDLCTAKYDVQVDAIDHGETIELRAEYSTDLFDEATVVSLMNSTTKLLAAAVSDPDRPFTTIPLTAAPRERPPAPRASSGCLHQGFEQQAKAAPHRMAVTDGRRSLKYGELNAAANQLARRLRRHGVGPEEKVLLHLERSVEAVVAMLAVLKAGGAYVPVDTTHPASRIETVAAAAGVRAVISDAVQRSGPDWGDLPVLRPTALARPDETDLDIEVHPANLAYVIYTSGSTGTPKGVAIEHRQVTRLFPACARWLEMSDRDVWSVTHSFAFDVSVWEVWGALLHGGRVVVVPDIERRDPARLCRFLALHGVTILSQTPSAFSGLLAAPPADLARAAWFLRAVVFAGEALDFAALTPWTSRFGVDRPALINMYGITEITVHGTAYRITRHDLDHPRRLIGEPLPDLEVRVVGV